MSVVARFSPDGRELDLAKWTYVLGLEGVADRMLELHEMLCEEELALPRWAWLRRRRVRQYEEAAVRLYRLFAEYAQQQEEAS